MLFGMKKEAVTAALRQAGFRATKQRVALLTTLLQATKPHTIQQISDRLGRSVDTVTVYRMISTFKKAGLVREINLRGGVPRYELNDEHDHHHIVCTDCGRIEDFTDAAHERIEKQVLARSRSFEKITGHSFDLYGICKSCAG